MLVNFSYSKLRFQSDSLSKCMTSDSLLFTLTNAQNGLPITLAARKKLILWATVSLLSL